MDERLDVRAHSNFHVAHETRSEVTEARRILPADRGSEAQERDDGLCLPVMSKHPRALPSRSRWRVVARGWSYSCRALSRARGASLTSVLVCILFLYLSRNLAARAAHDGGVTAPAVIEFALAP